MPMLRHSVRRARPMKNKTIKVDYLARVEGEGALYVKIKGDKVADVKLKIIEPPRFFEAFLRGRAYSEVPDIVARICGICPVAYQMSAVHAIEKAFGVTVGGQLRELRRLLYCGEWIESHTLHVFMLHAPDFLGYPDAIRMAQDHPDIVQRGLQLKKAGNAIVSLLGGREIHPVNVRVGGFYRAPSKQEMGKLGEQLKRVRDTAVQEYEDHFVEEHVPYSTALHSTLKGHGAYFVGPLARYNLNFDHLSPSAQEAAQSAGLAPSCRNPFKSIIVRSVEILYALDEALRIIEEYAVPDRPAVEFQTQAASGSACTEAPRGILYHRYRLNDEGNILEAKIVPPTSQNQKMIEDDLWHYVAQAIDLPVDQLTLQCEQAIRNYDPCISCSTHFLKLHIERE